MSKCTCKGTPFIDAKCKPCLETLISSGNTRINALQEQIDGIREQISEISGTLDDAAFHLGLWNEGKHADQMGV